VARVTHWLRGYAWTRRSATASRSWPAHGRAESEGAELREATIRLRARGRGRRPLRGLETTPGGMGGRMAPPWRCQRKRTTPSEGRRPRDRRRPRTTPVRRGERIFAGRPGTIPLRFLEKHLSELCATPGSWSAAAGGGRLLLARPGGRDSPLRDVIPARSTVRLDKKMGGGSRAARVRGHRAVVPGGLGGRFFFFFFFRGGSQDVLGTSTLGRDVLAGKLSAPVREGSPPDSGRLGRTIESKLLSWHPLDNAAAPRTILSRERSSKAPTIGIRNRRNNKPCIAGRRTTRASRWFPSTASIRLLGSPDYDAKRDALHRPDECHRCDSCASRRARWTPASPRTQGCPTSGKMYGRRLNAPST